MEIFQNIDYTILIKAFIIGGLLCLPAQILIDKTKLTPARTLVLYVTLGAILGGLGIYKYLVDFAGCGATVPLTGFGNNLAQGVIKEIQQTGLLRNIHRRTTSLISRNSSSHLFWIHCLPSRKTENKKTITLQKREKRERKLSRFKTKLTIICYTLFLPISQSLN